MKKDLTLVILAAGMGSRFGGLKQVEPIGPNGEFIIDYSIYDAIKAGFTKVVFIIKEENYELFRNTVGKRIENKIQVEYVFQDINDIPEGIAIPSERVKPWGTAHAVLACKDKVNSDFVMINSDDFYGYDAYLKMQQFLQEDNKNFAMVAFQVINTMTLNGSVKRGVCKSQDGYLTSIIEASIQKENNQIIATPLANEASFPIQEDALVSMNFFGFRQDIFTYLEAGINDFFKENQDNLLKAEYLIPDVIFKLIKENKNQVKVLETNSKWLGVTYKEDKEFVVSEINKLIQKGEYPRDLWK